MACDPAPIRRESTKDEVGVVGGARRQAIADVIAGVFEEPWASLTRIGDAGRFEALEMISETAADEVLWVIEAPVSPPLGEPPTPEGAIKKAISELRDLVVDLNDGPWGPTTDPQVGVENVINFTLKPALEASGVGGTGVRLTDEETRACLSAISDNDWAYYIADQGAEFLDALKTKLRASVGEVGEDG